MNILWWCFYICVCTCVFSAEWLPLIQQESWCWMPAGHLHSWQSRSNIWMSAHFLWTQNRIFQAAMHLIKFRLLHNEETNFIESSEQQYLVVFSGPSTVSGWVSNEPWKHAAQAEAVYFWNFHLKSWYPHVSDLPWLMKMGVQWVLYVEFPLQKLLVGHRSTR